MQQFVEKLTSSFARMSDEVVDFGQPGRDEIPVEFVHYSKLAGESRGYMSGISHDDIDPGRFEVPDGYKQQEMPELPELVRTAAVPHILRIRRSSGAASSSKRICAVEPLSTLRAARVVVDVPRWT